MNINTPSPFTRRPVLKKPSKSIQDAASTPVRVRSEPRTGSNPSEASKASLVSTPRGGDSPDLDRYALHIKYVPGSKKTQSDMPPKKTLAPKAGKHSASRPASTSKSTPKSIDPIRGSESANRPSTPQAFLTYLSNHAKIPPSSDKISDAWQVTIAEYISFSAFSASSHTFANPMNEKIALAIAKNLGMFTNPEAQESIAKSIFEGKLGEPMSEDVALAIAKNLGTFTNDDAQKSIAESINTGKFGNSGEFGDIMSEAVAIAIADKLHIFTNEEARKNISAAIANGLFGGQIPNSATSAIVKNLVMFTNTEAQRNISTAISEGRFSDGHFENPLRPIIAVAIAKNLPRFTDAKAQLTLSAAMAKGVFGNPIPQDVNKALLSILGGSGLGA